MPSPRFNPASHRPLHAAALALMLLAGTPCAAQTLDLDGPTEPAVGESSVLAELARRAARERSAPRRALEGLGDRTSQDDHPLILRAVETTADLTEALATLAQDPEIDAEARSILALQVLTLHSGRAAIDELWLAHRDAARAARLNPTEDATRLWQASRHHIEHYASTGERHARLLRAIDADGQHATLSLPNLDSFGACAIGAIVPLALDLRGGVPGTRWPDVSRPADSTGPTGRGALSKALADALPGARSPVAELGALIGESGVPEALSRYTTDEPESPLASLRRFAAALHSAELKWQTAPPARASARELLAALRFIERLNASPRLLEQERDAAAIAALDAAGRFCDPKQRDTARAHLRAAAACDAALVAMASLNDHRPAETRHLWTAMGRALVMAGADSTRQDAIRGAGLIERAAKIAAQREALPPTPQVRTGQFKAYRDLVDQMNDAEQRVFEELPELLDHPQRIESPQTVSLLARYRTGVASMATLLHAHRHIEHLRSLRTDGGEDAARRIEAQIKALGEESTRSAALDRLMTIEAQYVMFESLPDYSVVRTPTPATSAVLGESAPAFVQAVYDAKQTWIDDLAQGLPTDQAAMRADAMRIVHELMDDAQTLAAPNAEARLQEWAGWESPPGALAMLARSLADRTRNAAMVAARAEPDEALRVAKLAHRESAAARAAAMAVRALEQADPAPPPTDASGRAVSIACQLYVAPTVDSVLAGARAPYAELCRWLWERAAAEGRADTDLVNEIDVYLIECGAAVLDAAL